MDWITDNWIEIFGAAAGIIYVFLEIRQKVWLWPVGIITSAVYLEVFFSGKLYADMSLQGYYLIISILGWYWWLKGTAAGKNNTTGTEEYSQKEPGRDAENTGGLKVTRLKTPTGVILAAVFIALHSGIWFILSNFTDSPVPGWDSFITSLSVIATWMLARKIYEHWYLWIIANAVSVILFTSRGLYPTMVLYFVYLIMSFAGLIEWKKGITTESAIANDSFLDKVSTER